MVNVLLSSMILSIENLIRPSLIPSALADNVHFRISFIYTVKEIFICLQRYRRGQRGGRSFQRGGHKHFNNRADTRNDTEGSSTMDTPKNQTTEQSKDGDKESKSEDPTRLENGADPLSLVLDGSYNEEDDAGMSCIKINRT